MEPYTLMNTLKIYKNILTILLLCSLTIAVPIYTSDIPEEATRVEASIGGYAVLDCHLDFPFGNEIPYHLQWDKDGEWILSWYSGDGEPSVADRYTGRLARLGVGHEGLGRGSVNVSAIREADAGLYRCTVSFPNRTPPTRNNGTFYSLEVNGSNLIVSPPVNATVLEGEPAELECQPKTLDSTVRWFKDGRPLEQLQDIVARITIGENGSLVIPKTEITDPGEYSCSVTDKDGLTQTASAVLDVQYKAKVVYSPSELYLPFGKAASLDCHFSANPPLTNLRWEKDGFLFDPYNVPGVFYSRNGSLLFNKVDESHEGSYSCTPYNALGTRGAGGRVRVRVLRAPGVRAPPAPLYVPRLGDTLTLPCHPDTHEGGDSPPYQIYWTRKDGAPLPPHRWSLSGGNLTITNISATDGGQYVCVIQNEASAATAATEVRIENLPPRAPQTLSAMPAPRSIKLRWKPGQSHVETEYTIWYRQRLASEWRTVKLLSLGVTEATVLDLRPSTEYELRVLAQDPIGDGLFSRPIYVTTLEEDQSKSKGNESGSAATVTPVTQSAGQMAPLEVSIRLVGSGALVSWGRVGSDDIDPGSPGSDPGSGDSSLCVMRAYTGSEQALAHDKQTNDHYAMIPSVAEGERYWVQVECEAAVGSAFLQVHMNIHEYPTSPSIQPSARGVSRLRSGSAVARGLSYSAILSQGPALPTDEQLGKTSTQLSNVDTIATSSKVVDNISTSSKVVDTISTPLKGVDTFSTVIVKGDKLTNDSIVKSIETVSIETPATKIILPTTLVEEEELSTQSSKKNMSAEIYLKKNISNTPFKVDMLATPREIFENLPTVADTTIFPSLTELSETSSTINTLTTETVVNKLSTPTVKEIPSTSSAQPNILSTASSKEQTITTPTTLIKKLTAVTASLATTLDKFANVKNASNETEIKEIKTKLPPLESSSPQLNKLFSSTTTVVDKLLTSATTVKKPVIKLPKVQKSTTNSITVDKVSTIEDNISYITTAIPKVEKLSTITPKDNLAEPVTSDADNKLSNASVKEDNLPGLEIIVDKEKENIQSKAKTATPLNTIKKHHKQKSSTPMTVTEDIKKTTESVILPKKEELISAKTEILSELVSLNKTVSMNTIVDLP